MLFDFEEIKNKANATKWYGTEAWYDILNSIADCEDKSRPQGEWIPCTKEGLALTELMRREGKKWYGYRCTNCSFIYKGNALTESPFCQNCGAKMKGAD